MSRLEVEEVVTPISADMQKSLGKPLETSSSADHPYGPSLLTLEDVAIAYESGAKPVVEQISLSIHQGEAILFLGPSGCGKSTVAMLCAGLIPRAVEGVVSGTVMQSPILETPGAIGYVFQDADAQFCMLQVADEVAFGMENAKVDPRGMSSRISRGLTDAGLAALFASDHSRFSGGMKQKLAIASALAMDATMLILDEPTANLDPLATRQVFEQIGRLRESGQTLLVIEHKFDLLLEHIDTVILFGADGRIHRVGDARTVVEEEWSWMIEQGVVPPWKSRPFDSTNAGHLLSATSHSSVAQLSTPTPPDPQDAAIVVERGRLTYPSHTVWQNVNLRIPTASFTAIVGPNGAGKSSLLEAMAGLRKLSDGEVRIQGKPTSKWQKQALHRTVSYCFQNPEYQFIYERVADELANQLLGDDIPRKIIEGLRPFGLDTHALHSPYGLSQGQKRRLSVAVMLREAHDLYLLDEPTFGQDARTQQVILDELKALNEAGKTIVMSTHDMDLVRRYASHVLVVAEGGIIYDGTPADLFTRVDILRWAHLLDDVEGYVIAPLPGGSGQTPSDGPADASSDGYVEAVVDGSAAVSSGNCAKTAPVSLETASQRKKTPASRLNPGWHLISIVGAVIVAILARNIAQGAAMLAIPILLMMVIGWMSPWRILKRLSPFLAFYVLYVFMFSAYSAVGPHTPTWSFLWFRFSWEGVRNGVVLALRMLGAVSLGALFVTSTDMTDLMVSLSRNFKVQPRFAYGILAGMRFIPLFQQEWRKLRMARQLRGKDARSPLLRPVTYALPLLAGAIRMSERVAVAMEARGFYAQAAEKPDGRTYYRSVPYHRWDIVYMVGLWVVLAIALVWLR